MPKTNVVLFGASGSGKSSIVNMLSADEDAAKISSGARGQTFESQAFDVDVLGQPVTLWDTAGLDEGDEGRVSKSEAILQLYKLLLKLEEGVSLLMFVMRAPRIMQSAPQNWKLFRDVICRHAVPTVIVITGLEQEDDMDQWWLDNKGAFQAYGIFPEGYACITASRGKALKKGTGHKFDDEYEESQKKVQKLIRTTSLDVPWHVPPAEWFKTIINTTYSYESDCFRQKKIRHDEEEEVEGEAFQKLIDICQMSKDEAKKLAEKMRGI